ncbi:putative binding protein component of ABC iron transporter precursor [Pseudovibrio sp. Ad5]|uniref:ABC transporter substrate-binding protein n=1 Tax=Pseudovibrio sp. Ad5 TaxID=989436 RepID=UPI0007AEA240|nr:ABC transporter substrate-binding protein [Pseudovibrio sp. Ad5]KZK92645.1 putative binding protein component of ABC iron transporter precursor [Pseudovibrio sp. Ad5]
MKSIKKALLGATLIVGAGASPASADELNVICSADNALCEKLAAKFEEKSGADVSMIRLSSGEAYAKIRAEARNPQTDVWWGGTGDPHLQAANDQLSVAYKSPMLEELLPWAVAQAETSGYRTVGVYSGALGWGYNKEILAEKGIEGPKCWSDLLNPALKGEISIADPNSSGTAYTALATLVQLMGEEEAFEYLLAMGKNVSQYTKSGSAPVKAAARGEAGLGIVFMHDAVKQAEAGFPIEVVAPCEGTGYEIGSMSLIDGAPNPDTAKVFYDWVLTPEAQNLMAETGSYQIPSNKGSTQPEAAPKLENVRLIDYDFAEYGSSDRRRNLLARWDMEVGAAAN